MAAGVVEIGAAEAILRRRVPTPRQAIAAVVAEAMAAGAVAEAVVVAAVALTVEAGAPTAEVLPLTVALNVIRNEMARSDISGWAIFFIHSAPKFFHRPKNLTFSLPLVPAPDTTLSAAWCFINRGISIMF
jgi:hypothetical protein